MSGTTNKRAVFRRNTCRLCARGGLELVLRLPPTPPGDHYIKADRLNEAQACYPIDLALCRDCGFVQLLDVVDPDILYGNYIYSTQSSPGLDEHFQKYADSTIARLSIPAGAFLVEFGSNDGTLLRRFKERGVKTLGVDPAAAVARAATEAGVETINAYFTAEVAERIVAEKGRADVIIANNVVANIDDLDAVGEAVRHLLAPGGAFVFESGYLLDLVRNNVFDNIYHEHLSYLSAKPLVSFFRGKGMEVVDVEHVPTKGGSIRVTTQLAGGGRQPAASVAQAVAEEESAGIYAPQTYTVYGQRLAKMKADLLTLLDALREEGKKIAGYGASTSVTTLGYYFDVWDKLDFIVDDNPIKQNRYTPGAHVPVLPSDALYEKKPDYVVVLPWRFAEQIRARHKVFSEKGGRFIVPVPALAVY